MITETTNQQVVLLSRPDASPTPDNFGFRKTAVPNPVEGQLLLRTLFLSLDPYMRGRMSDAASYQPPVPLGAVMVGRTVSRVVASKHPDYQVGDLVLSSNGWQEFALSDGTGVTPLDSAIAHPSLALGVLGMPGFTAYMGLLDIGQPRKGETVVVAAASGPVGSAVGQIAKLRGCRVIGIAGGPNKCRYVKEKLGFDACLDHREANLQERLAKACPSGIDIYFENVGGAVFDAVLPLLNTLARIPLSGLVSQYNGSAPGLSPDRLGPLLEVVLRKRIRIQGFITFMDYAPRFQEFYEQMSEWVLDGRVKFLEDIVDGIENSPKAFIGMLCGENRGKVIVRVRAKG